MTYDDMYNARLNINKEKISRGRAPTQNNVKVVNGEENINIMHKKQMADVNLRITENNKITQKIRSKDDYEINIYKDTLPNNMNDERIKPDILDQYKKNPYTQPLDSYGICT